MPLVHAHTVRVRATMTDRNGRHYARLSPNERRACSLPNSTGWWWCALPPRRRNVVSLVHAPRVGHVVGSYIVHRVALGFVRNGVVGVVGMR
jgi:hypothetical protein